MEHKDIVGTEVKVGDKVAFRTGINLWLGYVDKLCPRTVACFTGYKKYTDRHGIPQTMKLNYTYVSPCDLVVVERDGRRMLDEQRKREEKQGVTESFVINLGGDSKVRTE